MTSSSGSWRTTASSRTCFAAWPDSNDADREAARHALAEVLKVAHATSEEEKEVYPTLRPKDRAITAHEEEHGEEEHAEIIEALLEAPSGSRAPTRRSTTTPSRS